MDNNYLKNVLTEERNWDKCNTIISELALHFTSGNSVPVTRVVLDQNSKIVLMLKELYPEHKFTQDNT